MERQKRTLKKETFIQGILALMFSQVLIKILGLVYNLYLTNRNGFGDEGNAIYSSGYQIYALLLAISSIGVPNAISKMISECLAKGDKKGANRVFKIAFITFAIIGIIGTCFLFFGAKTIATYWLRMPEAEYVLIALSPAIFFVSISCVVRGYFNGKEKMRLTARAQTFEQIFKTTLTILFVEIIAIASKVNTVYMAAGATLATTFATFSSFSFIYILYKKEKKIEGKEVNKVSEYDKKSFADIIKTILAVSIPISLSSILSAVNKNIDSATVVRILEKIIGYEAAKSQYGMLSMKVDTLTSLPLAFNIAFATALVPAIAGARVKNDEKTINKRISFSLLVTILIGLPCTIGMCLYANQIIKLLYPVNPGGGSILAIAAFTVIFTSIAQTINGALQGLGKVRVPAIALGLGVAAKFIANIVLIPIEGIGVHGAAIGSVLCHIISCTIGYNVLKRTVKLDFKLHRLMFKPIVATTVMAVCSYLCYSALSLTALKSSLVTIIAIAIAVIVYVIAVLGLKIFSKEDLLQLPKGEKIYSLLRKIKVYE